MKNIIYSWLVLRRCWEEMRHCFLWSLCILEPLCCVPQRNPLIRCLALFSILLLSRESIFYIDQGVLTSENHLSMDFARVSTWQSLSVIVHDWTLQWRMAVSAQKPWKTCQMPLLACWLRPQVKFFNTSRTEMFLVMTSDMWWVSCHANLFLQWYRKSFSVLSMLCHFFTDTLHQCIVFL